MNDYIVVTGVDFLHSNARIELEMRVRGRIKEGWRPLGGVSCQVIAHPDYDTPEVVYSQAMGMEDVQP